MAEIDFLVKLRDGLAMAVDACNEYLESLVPPEARDYDLEKIKWKPAEGPSGNYERAEPEENAGNPHYEALIADLDAHNGKLTKSGFFVWRFTNSDIIGRKRRNWG